MNLEKNTRYQITDSGNLFNLSLHNPNTGRVQRLAEVTTAQIALLNAVSAIKDT